MRNQRDGSKFGLAAAGAPTTRRTAAGCCSQWSWNASSSARGTRARRPREDARCTKPSGSVRTTARRRARSPSRRSGGRRGSRAPSKSAAAAASPPSVNWWIARDRRAARSAASPRSTSCAPRPRPFARGWTTPIADAEVARSAGPADRDRPVVVLVEPRVVREIGGRGQLADLVDADLRPAGRECRLVVGEQRGNDGEVRLRDRAARSCGERVESVAEPGQRVQLDVRLRLGRPRRAG